MKKTNYVITNQGSIPIDEIVNNFGKYKNLKALSWNADKNVSEWDNIREAMAVRVRRKDQIKIGGKSGFNLTVSDWHPMQVINEDNQVVTKRADQLVVGDRLLSRTTNVMKNRKSNMSPDMAYLLGYFMGDGNMGYEEDKGYIRTRVAFCDGDKRILDKINDILVNEGVVKKVNGLIKVKGANMLLLKYRAKSVVNLFESYGFRPGKKTHTVHLTDEIKKNLTEENAFALLGGLFDSDGCITKNDDFKFATISPQLAQDVMWLCHMLGIKATYFKETPSKYDPKRVNEKDVYRFFISYKYLYPHLDKLNMVKKVTGKHRGKSERRRPKDWMEITSLTRSNSGSLELFDIDTEKNHNYLMGNGRYVFC